jgi:hypothetical protein
MGLYDDLCRAFPAMLKASCRAANGLDAGTQRRMTKRLEGVEKTFRAASARSDQVGMLQAAKALCVLGEQIAVTSREQTEGVRTR